MPTINTCILYINLQYQIHFVINNEIKYENTTLSEQQVKGDGV